jgi:hypothetical protein
MREVKLTADVHASWSDTAPRYRVYVDQDLMTERDFVYPGAEIYITEHILVNLMPGGHTVKIEQINGDNIQVKNITVDGQLIESHEFVVTE